MRHRAPVVVLLGTVIAMACAQEEPPPPEATDPAADAAAVEMDHAATDLSTDEMAAVEQIRQTAGAWTELGAAQADGYTNQYPEGCIQTEAGGQGFHYMNEALVDDEIELDHPELVMFEPQADGSMQLVGVDYVIPFDQWTAAEPPTVLGRPMMRNEPLSVWALHIWTHRENPSGMFAAFNPNVSCEHAVTSNLP